MKIDKEITVPSFAKDNPEAKLIFERAKRETAFLTWLYKDKNRDSEYAAILNKVHRLHTCRYSMYIILTDEDAGRCVSDKEIVYSGDLFRLLTADQVAEYIVEFHKEKFGKLNPVACQHIIQMIDMTPNWFDLVIITKKQVQSAN